MKIVILPKPPKGSGKPRYRPRGRPKPLAGSYYIVGEEVSPISDLRFQFKTSPYAGVSTVRGEDLERLNTRPVVIPASARGTVVCLPPSDAKYRIGHERAQYLVHWDNGEVTSVHWFDLVPFDLL